MNYENIINVFSYSQQDIKYNKYIEVYSNLINNWLNDNKFTKNQLIRYMLIGFFLDYRSSNHKNVSFNTIEKSKKDFDKSNKEISNMIGDLVNINIQYVKNDVLESNFLNRQKKNKVYNKITGEPVKTTEEYLELIKIDLNSSSLGKDMFDFVVYGR